MANQPQSQSQQSQPSSGQAQQHSQQQIVQAYQQHAQALGLPAGIDWHRLVPLIVQLVQVIVGGGGVMPQAQAGQQPSP
jgi:hypothetical protein